MEIVRKYLLLAGLAGGILLSVAWILFLAYEAGRLVAMTVFSRPSLQIGNRTNRIAVLPASLLCEFHGASGGTRPQKKPFLIGECCWGLSKGAESCCL